MALLITASWPGFLARFSLKKKTIWWPPTDQN
jgi:hypothetical protein